MSRTAIVAFAAGVLVMLLALLAGCRPTWPAGLHLSPPVQEPLASDAPRPFMHKGHVVQPRALYSIEALVLSTMRYRVDDNAEVSPLDFALGWGPMADKSVLDELRVRQNDRYFFWSSSGPLPVPREDIEESAANTHLAWGDEAVGDVLDDVDEGDVVRLGGLLVDVTFEDGHEMKTSLTRADRGGGACEVMWVEEAFVVER